MVILPLVYQFLQPVKFHSVQYALLAANDSSKDSHDLHLDSR